MKFIESQLQKGEEIKSVAKMHWFLKINYIYPSIFILAGFGGSTGSLFFGLILLLIVYLYVNSFEMALTNKRVIAKFGVIRRKTFEINLNKIEGCNLDQSIFGRIFNYASILVKGTGGGSSPFPYVANFQTFKNEVNEEIEK